MLNRELVMARLQAEGPGMTEGIPIPDIWATFPVTFNVIRE